MRCVMTSVLLCVAVLAVGCSSISVHYDYDPSVDFATLRTFDWLAIPVDPKINALNVERLKKALTAEMESKGMKFTTQNPDVHVAAHISKEEKVDISSFGYDCGPRGYWRGGYWGGGWSGGDVTTTYYEEGTLILDIVGAKTKQLLWRGVATTVLDSDPQTPEKKQEFMNEVAQQVLKDFPPPLKK